MSLLKSLSLLDWVDFSALLMVFFGVFFGHVASRNKSPAAEFWEGVLIVGLGIEMLTFPRHVVETAKLRRETEALRRENFDLQAAVYPRSIKDRKAFAGKLSEFANVRVVPFRDRWPVSSNEELEMTELQISITQTLNMAGWKVSPLNSVTLGTPGVAVSVNLSASKHDPNETNNITAAAKALIAALNNEGITTSHLLPPAIHTNQITNDCLVIFIGRRWWSPRIEKQIRDSEATGTNFIR